MTEFELFEFQDKAVVAMLEKCEDLLGRSEEFGTQDFVLMAPTAAGKTIIAAHFLKKWVDDSNHQLSFIWVAPNKLDDQSKDKVEGQCKDDQKLTCSGYDDLISNMIDSNEIFFVNWPSINIRNKNIIVTEREDGKYLENIVKNTKEDGRKIILIIDEGHNTAGGDESKRIIELIDPALSIYITATPGELLANCDDSHRILRDHVRDSGLISNNIIFNKHEKDSDTLDKKDILKMGLDKRNDLKDAFANENENVNPLLLIQLPDATAGNENMRDDVEQILRDEFQISIDNGKLAIWLSDTNQENHVNLDAIDENDNPVEVLIFKQAIAQGWDCPRASVLCLFRELQNVTFGVQVLGRLQRMPKRKHYVKNALLNSAYVYANFPEMTVADEVREDVIQNFSFRDESLWQACPIELTREYNSEKRKINELNSVEFNKIFDMDEIQEKMKKVKIENYQLMKRLVLDETVVDDIDRIESAITGEQSEYDTTPEQLQDIFTRVMLASTKGFVKNRSNHAIRNALYKSLEKRGLDITEKELDIQNIILSPDNISKIKECIENAKSKYKEKYSTVSQFKKEEYSWAVPPDFPEHDKNTIINFPKSIMQPFYEEGCNKLEQAFIKKLDDGKVKWLYRNRSSGSGAFAIPYEDEGFHEFFVDFIVKFEDGSIGLYDTKGWQELDKEKTRKKGVALAEYIKNQNTNNPNKKLKGGLIANTQADHTGEWKINTEAKFDLSKKEDWDTFNF